MRRFSIGWLRFGIWRLRLVRCWCRIGWCRCRVRWCRCRIGWCRCRCRCWVGGRSRFIDRWGGGRIFGWWGLAVWAGTVWPVNRIYLILYTRKLIITIFNMIWLQNNLCELIKNTQKFKRLHCPQKTVLNNGFKGF